MYGQDSSLVLPKKSDLAILVECQCAIFLAGSLIVGGIISLSVSLSLLSLVSYVREQLVQTVALMVKRATLEEDRRALFDSVFTTVTQLLMTENSKMVGL